MEQCVKQPLASDCGHALDLPKRDALGYELPDSSRARLGRVARTTERARASQLAPVPRFVYDAHVEMHVQHVTCMCRCAYKGCAFINASRVLMHVYHTLYVCWGGWMLC